MEASVAQAGGVMCVHSVMAALELGVLLLAFVSRRETGRLTVD